MKRVNFKELHGGQKFSYVFVKALQVCQILVAIATIASLTWAWCPLPINDQTHVMAIVSVAMIVIGCGYVFVLDLIIRPFRAIVLGEDW